MSFSDFAGQASRENNPQKTRRSRGSRPKASNAQKRRLHLEKLVARELLAADLAAPEFTDEQLLSAGVDVASKYKPGQEAAASADLVPVSIDSWLLSWPEGQSPRPVFGPSFLRSVEPTNLIKDTYIVDFYKPFTQPEALAELGLTHTPDLAYPLVPEQLTKRLIPGDGNFFYQYHLNNSGQFGGVSGEDINVIEVWDTLQGSGSVIGVIDDGIDYNHGDLSPNYNASLDYDFNDNDSDGFPNTVNDWHGTAMAGIAAARIGGGEAGFGGGVVGVAPEASITSIRLTANATTDAQNAAALNHQMNNIDIYLNSWGPADTGSILAPGQAGPLARAALENGAQNGRDGLGNVYVWAAGNGGTSDNVNYDLFANSRHTIAVGSMTHTGVETSYSERGASLIVVAPAQGGGTAQAVYTTDVNGPYGYNTTPYTNNDDTLFDGTSASAAQVAGVVALMLEANPNLTARDVQHILVNTARRNDAADPDWVLNGAGLWVNEKFGFGAVNAGAAVAAASTWTNVEDEISWESAIFTPNLSIPDNNTTGVTFQFGLPDNFQIEYVELLTDTTHTYGGDLRMVLTAPSGTQSFMTREHFVTPTYTFAHPLTSARHWEEDTFGYWSLNISDRYGGDIGTLDRAAFKVYGRAIDTALPNLSAQNVIANEADGTIDFEIVLESAQATDVTFEAVTFDGTAVAGVDYTPLLNVPFTIPAGETSVTISVPLIQDDIEEIAKTFSLGLTNFSGSDPLVRAAVGEIVDDDDPPFYTANPRDQIGPGELIVSQSVDNPILLNTLTDIDDLQFEAVSGTVATATIDPASDTIILTAQYVDPDGALIGSPVTASSPGQTVVLPPTTLSGTGVFAVRVFGSETSEIDIDLLFNAVDEAGGADTSQTSSLDFTDSYVSLGSGRFVALGEFVSTGNTLSASKVNDPSAFVDISGTGTPLNLGDDGVVTITTTIGNEMLPAGSVRVSNNGMIVAGTTGTPSWSNGSIPTTTFNNFLAPYWDDLTIDGLSPDDNVFWQETTIDGIPALVVQWHQRPHYNAGDAVTLQAQIFASGSTKVRYVYQDIDFNNSSYDFGASATIGYQINPENFLQYSRNQAVLANGDVISFFTPEDIDKYTVDLTGMAGKKVDLAIVPLDGADVSGALVRLIGTDGTSILATASATPGGTSPTNYDLGILDFTVPADGVYTIQMTGTGAGKYAVVLTDSLAYDTESNDASTDVLRTLNLDVSGYGYAGAAGSATPDENEFYKVNLAVDDYIIVQTATPFGTGDLAVSNTLDPAVEMFAPDGSSLWSEDNTAEDGRNVFKYFRALEAGEYKLALSAAAGSGAYILDINEWVNRNPDDITLTPMSIEENAGDNFTVGTFATSDVDPGDTFTYTLVSGTGDDDNTAFSISGDTLVANSSFDFETKNSYTVRVRSTDQRDGFFEKAFTINIIDVNEVPTDITLTPSAINENSGADAAVGTLSTEDVDAGDTFTYTLVAGDGDTDNATFSIDGSTLKANVDFDHETKDSYTVRIRTTDSGGLFYEEAIVISVIDINETPTDITLSNASLDENAGDNAVVGAFTTTDEDEGDTFTYTLVAGTGDADNAAFNISGDSLRANSSFDFETKNSYTVRVRTTDSEGLFFEKSFVVTVNDVNDAPTALAVTPSDIDENTGDNTTVGTLTTTDQDAGDTFTYALVAGTGDVDNAAFTISDDQLILNTSANFEAKNSYSIRVETTDAGGLTFATVLTITVNDVNETPTDIALSASDIDENAGDNAVIGTLSTTDVDAGDTFTYTLVAGTGDTDNGAFNIDGDSLRANTSFDFETKDSYTVRVRTTDAGGLTFDKAFTITVNDVNETPTDIALSASDIDENAGDNAVIGTLSTTDVDAGDTFTYTLVAGTGDADNGAFNIDGDSLRANTSFDFETKDSYTVRVRTTDAGGLTFDKAFTITVNDVNETPTDIALTPSDIDENAGAGTTVGVLTTTDVDAGDTFTYVLVSGTGDADNASFSISGDELVAGPDFDFETKDSYLIRVQSTDAGGLTVEKALTVTINDVNEAPTDIALTASDIDENAGDNAVIGTLSTTDVDAGDTFTYTLVAGAGDADNSAFNIDGDSLRANASFDFETKNSYTVRVRTTDAGGLTFDKAFTITVNDVNETPTDIALSASDIDENAGDNAVIGTFGTTDVDAGDTFTYTLVAGTGDADNGAFNIDGDSLRANTSFDFETKDSYTVRVRTTDAGGLTFDKAFTITVNDVNETPTDIALTPSDIDENAGAGTTVGVLTTTDVDAGDTFTYTLVSGAGDTDNASFSISGDELVAGPDFDFETKDSYLIRVKSTDAGGLTVEKALTVTINDVNEAPTDIALSASNIDENAGDNAVIGTLSTTDVDAGDTFTYTLVAGTGDTDNGAFNIDGDSLRANASFDFETKDSYTVRVRTTDAGGLTFDKAFTITVNDVNETPTDIALSASDIDENAGDNAVIGTLSTTDVDAGDTFTYTLVAGTGDTDNGAFNIDGDSLRANTSFDFETKDSYTVRVRTTDAGGLTFDKAFTITVNDVNETPTDIALSASDIDENAGDNAVIGTLSTTDVDAGDTFTYTLVAGTGDTDNGAFNIDGDSLRANASFDFEIKDSYTVRVRTTDAGGLTFDKAFTITVNDVNETPTDIALTPASIAENSGTGVTVGALTTIDADAGDTFTYALVAGTGDSDNALFSISGDQLVADADFDFETKSSYTVRVESTDAGGLKVQKALTITVTDVNEGPTDITISSSTVLENAVAYAEPVVIGTLTAVDEDNGDSHTFSLVSGDGDADNALFSIDGDVLSLIAGTTVDFETKPSYTVRVKAVDAGGLETEKELAINVNNRGELEVVTVGDGTAQRSMVRGMTVTFDSVVTVGADAFTVIKRGTGGGAVDVAFTTTTDGQGRTVASLTFSGTFTASGSLVDGNYELQIDGSKITDAQGLTLDMDRDGTDGGTYSFGDDAADKFFRMYGDINGDRAVGFPDFVAFRQAFGSSSEDPNYDDRFDANDDGSVGFLDFVQFRNRFGNVLDFE